MAAAESARLVQVGEPAPDFTLPAVAGEGTVSLADYRGRSPVLLALFRGVYCPFCRRAIARLGAVREKLLALGVDSLGIVASSPERARLYFRHRPARVPLAADPEFSTHRSYGLPSAPVTPELIKTLQSVRVNPTGELPEPLPIWGIWDVLNQRDGFEGADEDGAELQRRGVQFLGQFLVDRDGIVRWINIEGAREGLAGAGKFPTDEELLAAARALAG